MFVSEPISSGAIRGTDRDGRASSVGRPQTRVRKRRVRRRPGARAAPPCVRSRLARGGRGRSRACRMRALGECRGGEESGRRTHPDVRVRDIALRVCAVLDVRRVRLERRRRHVHAPPSAAAAAHGARLARTRVPVRSTPRQSEPRHTRRGLERARARTNSARARVRRSRAPRTRPRSIPPLDARGRRVVTACETRRDPTTPLPFERKHRQKPKRGPLESTAFRVRSSFGVVREHRANLKLYGNQSLRSANPIYKQSR